MRLLIAWMVSAVAFVAERVATLVAVNISRRS